MARTVISTCELETKEPGAEYWMGVIIGKWMREI